MAIIWVVVPFDVGSVSGRFGRIALLRIGRTAGSTRGLAVAHGRLAARERPHDLSIAL